MNIQYYIDFDHTHFKIATTQSHVIDFALLNYEEKSFNNLSKNELKERLLKDVYPDYLKLHEYPENIRKMINEVAKNYNNIDHIIDSAIYKYKDGTVNGLSKVDLKSQLSNNDPLFTEVKTWLVDVFKKYNGISDLQYFGEAVNKWKKEGEKCEIEIMTSSKYPKTIDALYESRGLKDLIDSQAKIHKLDAFVSVPGQIMQGINNAVTQRVLSPMLKAEYQKANNLSVLVSSNSTYWDLEVIGYPKLVKVKPDRFYKPPLRKELFDNIEAQKVRDIAFWVDEGKRLNTEPINSSDKNFLDSKLNESFDQTKPRANRREVAVNHSPDAAEKKGLLSAIKFFFTKGKDNPVNEPVAVASKTDIQILALPINQDRQKTKNLSLSQDSKLNEKSTSIDKTKGAIPKRR